MIAHLTSGMRNAYGFMVFLDFFQDPKLRAENPKYEKARGDLFSRGDLVCQGGTFVIPFNLRFRFMNPTVMQIFSDLYQVCIAHLFQVFMI